jgi:hypothetical protein
MLTTAALEVPQTNGNVRLGKWRCVWSTRNITQAFTRRWSGKGRADERKDIGSAEREKMARRHTKREEDPF